MNSKCCPTFDSLVGRQSKTLDHVSANQVTGPVDPVGAVNADDAVLHGLVLHEGVESVEELLHDAHAGYHVALAQDLLVKDALGDEKLRIIVAGGGCQVEDETQVRQGAHQVLGAELQVRRRFHRYSLKKKKNEILKCKNVPIKSVKILQQTIGSICFENEKKKKKQKSQVIQMSWCIVHGTIMNCKFVS